MFKGIINKIFIGVGALALLPVNLVMAAPEFGKNTSTWALDQMFWVAIMILAGACIKFITRKDTIGLIVTILLGVVVIAIIKDPTGLKTIGDALWSVIKGA